MTRGAFLAVLCLGATLVAPAAPAASAPPPAGWPHAKIEIGLRDDEGKASSLRSRGEYGLRYHYLSGGVNTGRGWTSWTQGGGSFIGAYVDDSVRNGFTPVFSYYQLFESAPARAHGDEQRGFLTNLKNADTMRAYWEDLALFMKKAGERRSTPVVLHVEPDAWGWMQKASSGDSATSVQAMVGSTGFGDVAGLPDNAAGFAQAVVRLRDRYAPNVMLGYHLSPWGSDIDPALSTGLNDGRIDEAAGRSVSFLRSLGASFDLVFAEFADRDAGYRQHVNGSGADVVWDAADFERQVRYLAGVNSAIDRPLVLWQIPLGNGRMRAMDNTRFHYQDNKVEWLLDDPGGTHLAAYRDAGVIALLFGGAFDGATCACDAAGDGVTNPTPIGGNVLESLSADDDGGFFHARARDYYSRGGLGLPGGVPPRPPVAAEAPRSGPRARIGPARRGKAARIAVSFGTDVPAGARIRVSVYGGGKRKAVFTATRTVGSARRVTLRWRVPKRAVAGRYVAKVALTGEADGRPFRRDGRPVTFRVR